MSNNNNKKHNYERKARSSRFTPKIREYLAEIANERETELERFMMLSSASPASSGVSVGAPCPQHDITANNNSSCRVLAEAGEAAAVQIVNIPIVMVNKQQEKQQENEEEEEEEEEQQLLLPPPPSKVKSSCSVSVEDLRTPTKDTHTQTHTQPQMHTRKTQTPESALKSHKRLEWDPAADVGYHRSMGSNNSCERAMSTSNISTLERSVLEAAMQPLQATQRANQSETDLKRLQLEKERVEKPPLASSTFVQRAPRSTPVSSSRRDSCVTSSAASSFDYQPNLSRPSTAGTGRSQSRSQSQSQSQSSRRSSSSYQQLQQEQQSQSLNDAELKRQEREYAAQLEQKLSQRRRQHNKENQEPSVSTSATSASSACSSLPLRSSSGFKNDVDLGIDLLCALVNKRSLSSGQKKQLARDIIKRLVGLDLVCSSSGGGGGGSKSSTHVRNQRSKEQAQQTEHHENPVKDNSQRQDVATNTSRSLQPEQQQQQPKQQQLLSLPVPAPRTRLATPTNEQQMEPCSYASTSSAASNELLTQKINVQRANQEHDEQAAVQEWLNPMTQSEIEYEQRQMQRQRQQRNNLSLERRTQIDWIEGEIRRLYALQELLHRGGRGGSEEQVKSSREAEQQELEQQSAEKEGKTTLPVPAPPAPPVTPVSMPATNVVAGEDKATTTAAATATSRTSTADKLVRIEPRARKTSETVEKVIQIEAAADVALAVPATVGAVAIENRATTVARQQQRSKMATPQLSHSGSSESVCSFVQQRQRQFLAHYQNQQQQRREQQQQQQLFRRHQQQQRLFYEQHPSHAACHLHPPATHCHRHHQHHPPHYVQMQYAQATASNESGAIYYQVVNSQEVQRATAATKVPAAAAGVATVAAAAAAAAAGTATVERSSNTSSSLLCLSSEMSIPMGMATACEATTTTTTTTTTTHQYDDVACQQLQLQQQLQRQRRHHTVKQLELQQQQQLLQVRPRGIAYVLQFNSHTNDDDDDAVGQILTETLTVQDYLQRARPEFCVKSKQRKAILNEMQLLRNARRRELDELIEGHSVETIDRRLQQLPPPVTDAV
ncbi:centrosome-associated protein Alms1a-like isoform X2 [Drosophila sulfurigaster albostrigata]|uniref:centrosome-associated protein Alms1a-like isoform X2 n=1 Tax=Drosophila sulfurigaster albostrigata TaxID=89887 RepID=UPI002D21C62D|nr:centrosome-associated protein Alms1a-like isoform X2 [Drosophila sulfurigaster albostrigata]